MSALSDFLAGDRRATAVVVAAVAAGSVAGLSAYAPAPDARIATREATVALVRFDVHADRLSALAKALRASTAACLSDQAAMLDEVAVSDVQRATDALEARSRSVRDERRLDTVLRESHAVAERGRIGESQGRDLLRHIAFREACLDWTTRSVNALASGLTAGTMASLAGARAMAGRDAEMVRAMDAGGIPEDAESVERMETFGRGP